MVRVNRVLDKISLWLFGRKQKGSVLAITLLIATVGAIIISGLFLYLDASLRLASQSEENALNFYACDAGIETGIYHILHSPCNTSAPSYNASFVLNGLTVAVEVECIEYDTESLSGNYSVNSSTLETNIEAYVSMYPTANFTVNSSNCINASFKSQIITYTIK